jgi:hypothetical protein
MSISYRSIANQDVISLALSPIAQNFCEVSADFSTNQLNHIPVRGNKESSQLNCHTGSF